MRQQPRILSTQQGRQRAVTFVLRLTRNTSLAPPPYEQQLLEQFVRGELSLDQLLERLETPPGPAGAGR